MVDRDIISVAGSVGGATAVGITLIASLYEIFRDSLSTIGAITLAAMGVLLFVILVLTITNHTKIQSLESDSE